MRRNPYANCLPPLSVKDVLLTSVPGSLAHDFDICPGFRTGNGVAHHPCELPCGGRQNHTDARICTANRGTIRRCRTMAVR